jgi:DegV family protein with EDD domain
MSQVCILTDSTAQFPVPTFPGNEFINVIPLHIQLSEQQTTLGKDVKLSALPLSARNSIYPQVYPPSVEEFSQVFTALGHRCKDIIAILISSRLNQAIANAQEAADTIKCPANIHIIDSQTTAAGLGLLVQIAAQAVQSGIHVTRINRLLRGLVPRIYTVFCVQSLTYLSHAGYLDPAQAVVGEMLGITPFLILENGQLTPVQKVRSSRHLIDILNEFVYEFDNLRHVALIHGVPPFDQEARTLRERINGALPPNSISEHTLGIALAAMLGPRSLGRIVMENCTNEL